MFASFIAVGRTSQYKVTLLQASRVRVGLSHRFFFFFFKRFRGHRYFLDGIYFFLKILNFQEIFWPWFCTTWLCLSFGFLCFVLRIWWNSDGNIFECNAIAQEIFVFYLTIIQIVWRKILAECKRCKNGFVSAF